MRYRKDAVKDSATFGPDSFQLHSILVSQTNRRGLWASQAGKVGWDGGSASGVGRGGASGVGCGSRQPAPSLRIVPAVVAASQSRPPDGGVRVFQSCTSARQQVAGAAWASLA